MSLTLRCWSRWRRLSSGERRLIAVEVLADLKQKRRYHVINADSLLLYAKWLITCQKEKMTRQGIEPRTFPSHGGCSTAELHGRLIG
jgi:hypothetical protein